MQIIKIECDKCAHPVEHYFKKSVIIGTQGNGAIRVIIHNENDIKTPVCITRTILPSETKHSMLALLGTIAEAVARHE